MSAVQSLRRPSRVIHRESKDLVVYGLGEPLVLAGHYAVTVLKGAVDIGGTVLRAGAGTHHVSCPQPPYYSLCPAFTDPSNVDCRVPGGENFVAVVQIDLGWEPPNLSGIAPQFKGLWPERTSERSGGSVMRLPTSWRDLGLNLPPRSRILILGPKNSGKSSLGRYLSNLREYTAWMELDPGQCEFSPSGTLSLHTLRALKLLGPSWTHVSEDSRLNTVSSHSLGYTSPMETPQRYLAMCQELVASADALDAETAPDLIIVNTPGWTKGLGLELNISLAEMSRPTHIVHIGDDGSGSLLDIRKALGSGVTVLESIQPLSEGTEQFSAAELRSLQTLAYLHQNDTQHITQWTPWQVSLSDIHVAILDAEGTQPSDTCIAIEGTLVAVLSTQASVGTDWLLDQETTDLLYTHATCIGYAVVQAATSKWLRLLTPLHPESFGNNNIILCRGRLGLPLWAMWSPALPSDAPWLAPRAQGIGGAYTKFRRNIKR